MAQARERSRVVRGLRISLFVLLGLLGLAEVGVRLAGPSPNPPPLTFRFANRLDAEVDGLESVFRSSPSLFWDLLPGAEFQGLDWINSTGMRGPAATVLDDYRIAVLGDSCTFGIGVEFEETYGAVLEQTLGEAYADRRIHVVNGGIPGYTIFQGRRFFEERVLPLEPDVAVLYYGVWNDFNPAMGSGMSDRELGSVTDAPGPSAKERLYGLLRHSRLFDLLADRYAGTLRYRHWRATVNAWLAGEPPDGYRVPLDAFEEILADFLERCAEHGTNAVVVLPELNRELYVDQPIHEGRLERYREAMRRIAGERGVPTVDLRELFGGTSHEELFADTVHPSPEGHRRLGRALAERIVEAGWLD